MMLMRFTKFVAGKNHPLLVHPDRFISAWRDEGKWVQLCYARTTINTVTVSVEESIDEVAEQFSQATR